MKVTIELTPEQLSKIASEIDGTTINPTPEYRDINEVFPLLGLAGSSSVQHVGSVEFGDDEERTYLMPTSTKEGARVRLHLGAPGSTLGAVMALRNGAGIFVETMTGQELTVTPNRTDFILSSEPQRTPTRFNFGGNWSGATPAQTPHVLPGEPLVIRLVRGNKLNDRGEVTFTYRS